MISKEVSNDLKNIQYYYSRQKEIDTSSKTIVFDKFYNIVNNYNKAVEDLADPKLYEVYSLIYVQGLSVEATAEELDFSYIYTQQMIKELKTKLTKYFESKEKGA